MIPLSSGVLVVAALLTGAANAGELPAADRCPLTSRFELAADSTDVASDVCVSADEPTTFFFDSRVAVGAVEFEPGGRLADWSQGHEGLTINVVPRDGFLAGERIRMTVRFADATLPTSASFWLVGHADRGTRRVEAYRQPRPADTYKREATDAQADLLQCRDEKAQLLSERNEPGGLMGAVALNLGGSIATKDVWQPKQRPASALRFVSGTAYSYTRAEGSQAISLAVWLRLLNPGDGPWTTGGASLLDSTGEQVGLAAFQSAPIVAGTEGNVVLGTEREPGKLACPCTVKLWDSPGTRVVTLGNIIFPDAPKPKR